MTRAAALLAAARRNPDVRNLLREIGRLNEINRVKPTAASIEAEIVERLGLNGVLDNVRKPTFGAVDVTIAARALRDPSFRIAFA